MAQYKWRMKISDQFSGVIVCQQKTDLKQPTLSCGLGLKTFCFSSDNVFWNSCVSSAMTDPEGDSCFSIYEIIWIKIKKELLVHKRRHFVRVCLRFNGQCFGDYFLWFCREFNEKIFFYQPVNTEKPNFVSFWVLVGAAASFTAIHLSKLLQNEKPFWIPSQNSEYPRIFRVKGANQDAWKLLSTDLVNTNAGYPRLSSQWERVKNTIHCFSIY